MATAMEDLAADLIVLAARRDGKLDVLAKLRFGLSASELVRLAAARRIDIAGERILVLDTAPTGDLLLDEALARVMERKRPNTAKAYVARPRPGLVKRYLARLEDDGIIQADRRTVLRFIPVTRWVIVDTARVARSRATLQAVAGGAGTVEPAQAALAGLACAIGAASYVFPGVPGVPARKRLREAAMRDPAAAAAGRTDTNTDTNAAIMAAISVATAAATAAATSAGGFN